METVYKTAYSRHECSHFVCNFCAWRCFATRKVPTFCPSASPLVSRLPSSLAATHWRVKRGEHCIHFHPRHSPKPYLLLHLDFKDSIWRSSSFLSVLFCCFLSSILGKTSQISSFRKRFSFAVYCLLWVSHREIIKHSCTDHPAWFLWPKSIIDFSIQWKKVSLDPCQSVVDPPDFSNPNVQSQVPNLSNNYWNIKRSTATTCLQTFGSIDNIFVTSNPYL